VNTFKVCAPYVHDDEALEIASFLPAAKVVPASVEASCCVTNWHGSRFGFALALGVSCAAAVGEGLSPPAV
jgi:hypothetical protein